MCSLCVDSANWRDSDFNKARSWLAREKHKQEAEARTRPKKDPPHFRRRAQLGLARLGLALGPAPVASQPSNAALLASGHLALGRAGTRCRRCTIVVSGQWAADGRGRARISRTMFLHKTAQGARWPQQLVHNPLVVVSDFRGSLGGSLISAAAAAALASLWPRE